MTKLEQYDWIKSNWMRLTKRQMQTALIRYFIKPVDTTTSATLDFQKAEDWVK